MVKVDRYLDDLFSRSFHLKWRKFLLEAALGVVIAVAGIAVIAVFLAFLPLRQAEDSPGGAHTARLFESLGEGGPAPYGQKVTLSAAGDLLGRFTGDTVWIGYCAFGKLAWKSGTELELTCPRHPDGRDVLTAQPVPRGVAFRVLRK